MANELKLIFRPGVADVKAFISQSDGTERDFNSGNGITMSEVSPSPNDSPWHLYLGDCPTIELNDVASYFYNSNNSFISSKIYLPYSIAGDSLGVLAKGYLGDYFQGDSIFFLWRTLIAPTVNGTLKVYRNDGTTELSDGDPSDGITDTRDFDSITGLNLCIINLSTNSFYEPRKDYNVVLSSATINGESISTVIATFSIENRSGIRFIRDT